MLVLDEYLLPSFVPEKWLIFFSGGVRGIVQLEILRLLERELNGKIPVQFFFDMIVGKG